MRSRVARRETERRGAPSRRVAAAIVALAFAVSLAPFAHAFIPKARRIAGAVADVNRAAGRTQALRIQLAMRIGDGEPVAAGELVTHPTGMARLELRAAASNLVERHLLQGSDHRASRDGAPLASPRSFLPPLFLLQAADAVSLQAALASYGIDEELVGLAVCEDRECYVVGDPARVPAPTEAELRATELPRSAVVAAELWGEPLLTEDGEVPTGSEAEAAAETAGAEEEVEGDATADGEVELEVTADLLAETVAPVQIAHANVWIDMESFELRRIESQQGVGVALGPMQSFGPLRFPGWLVIEEPDKEPVTFEFLEVVPVNAPARAFSAAWLMTPAAPAAPGPADEATPEP